MAERKAREDRVITDIRDQAKTTSERKSAASSKRVIAAVFWVLAIAAEIAAIYFFNHFVVLWPCLLCLILDLIFCIVAALSWKKANDIDPPVGKFWKNQFACIMTLIAFIPLGLVLLKGAKDMPPQAKKILSIVAVVAFIAAMLFSIDYNPVTQADLSDAELSALGYGGTCYWAKYSKSYHFDPDCQALLRSKEVFQGTITQAFEEGRTDPCDFCAGGKDEKLINAIGGDSDE